MGPLITDPKAPGFNPNDPRLTVQTSSAQDQADELAGLAQADPKTTYALESNLQLARQCDNLELEILQKTWALEQLRAQCAWSKSQLDPSAKKIHGVWYVGAKA